jgi:hypothetical protein
MNTGLAWDQAKSILYRWPSRALAGASRHLQVEPEDLDGHSVTSATQVALSCFKTKANGARAIP